MAKHLRPLPPLEGDADSDYYHPDATPLYAPDPTGLKKAGAHIDEEYPGEVSPVDIVLCSGGLAPTALFVTIRPVLRPLDLLQDFAPASSPAPDKGIEDLEAERMAWKAKLKSGEIGPGESVDEAKWRIQRAEERLQEIKSALQDHQEAVRETWGEKYPAVSEEQATGV
jgi:hypothetical protein